MLWGQTVAPYISGVLPSMGISVSGGSCNIALGKMVFDSRACLAALPDQVVELHGTLTRLGRTRTQLALQPQQLPECFKAVFEVANNAIVWGKKTSKVASAFKMLLDNLKRIDPSAKPTVDKLLLARAMLPPCLAEHLDCISRGELPVVGAAASAMPTYKQQAKRTASQSVGASSG